MFLFSGRVATQNRACFYDLKNTAWADSVFKTLTPDDRIGQLFMVAAYSNKDRKHVEEINKLITDYKIGGLIFFQGGPVRQAILTNQYQVASKVPLMISIDGEWGLAMRLDSTIQFPRQMTLGAIQNDLFIYKMGAEIGRQCKRLGIHVNLAPVVDINSNPKNPVISNRSFGENKFNVASKALMYMAGMQEKGVMANAKHFPGHGDTDSDSHKTLPTITHSKALLDSLDLFPFKEMFKKGLGSLMVAHLFIPSLDTTKNTASTLSKKIVTGLLKDELKFDGLIFTDALNMKGVSGYFQPGVADVKALLAGNDVLLFSGDVPTAIAEIKKAIFNGEITQAEVDARCKKIMLAKQWCGLDNYKPIELKNLQQELNTSQANYINRQLNEAALTVLRNKNDLMPLQKLDTLKIASLTIGTRGVNEFQTTLDLYAPVKHFSLNRDASSEDIDSTIRALKNFNLVIVHLNSTNNFPGKNFGITAQTVYTLKTIIEKFKTIVNIPANPYALEKLVDLSKADAVILSYETNEYSDQLVPQLIFGGVKANGKIPVSSGTFKLGEGIETAEPMRMKYTVPEELGISSNLLAQIDTIALNGIKEKAYPGCEVLVAKNRKVIYYKSFGYHTYENKRAVKNSDIYDLASITKILASTPTLMRMVDEKKIGLDDRLCYHLPQLEGSNKQNIIIREMMTHQAGLRDWIPFWLKTMNKGEYKAGYYNKVKTDSFPTRIADNFFVRKGFTDTIYKRIIESEMKESGKFRYSDLGYYFLKKIFEDKTGIPLSEYVDKTFYKPLGLSTMGYLPLNKFPLTRIPPTEYDIRFRKQLVHGYVHDQGAAMMGGVGGHAGLFANANDVAVFMQLYLQKGEYAGVRYLDSTTVNEFTKCQYCTDNRRGIGFDKPETNPDKDSPVCQCVSYMSYGHSGFTGTLTWVDPKNGIVYVFLSNRVYPDAETNKLIKIGTRGKIQQVIYDVLK